MLSRLFIAALWSPAGKGMCDQGFVGAARFCAKWGIKLVQATLIPLARSYFPLNCEQADRQIFGLSVKSGLIIGHRNTSLLMSIS